MQACTALHFDSFQYSFGPSAANFPQIADKPGACDVSTCKAYQVQNSI
jgi:hypothetical protein